MADLCRACGSYGDYCFFLTLADRYRYCDARGREELMTKSRYGMIAGLAGAAFAAWWFRRRQTSRANLSASNTGEVIYRNTPKPSSEGII